MRITYVVPCGAEKLPTAAPARELYRGTMFRHTIANVERLAAKDRDAGCDVQILILSGLHGLITPDTVLEPYDHRIGEPGSVTPDRVREQALALGIDWGTDEVYALLPRPYLRMLDSALRQLDVYVQDVYEGCRGNGEQRRVNSILGRPEAVTAVTDPGPGPRVWIGADAAGLAWGTEILVNYGRLAGQATLPAAHAAWTCDSRGCNEIREHGHYRFSPERYAADLVRFAEQIGRLEWAACQDWPASQTLLDITGLTEGDHQDRTTASVVRLRQLVAGRVHILPVVTGTTLAGYLHHLAKYTAAGIDLATEPLVGVGSLVGRSPAEAAAIVRALHAAGLTRLHGFGVKGPALALIGPLLTSIDSAEWSGRARREVGRCPHGLVDWESNCPRAAQEWATQQRTLAASPHVQEMLPLAA